MAESPADRPLPFGCRTRPVGGYADLLLALARGGDAGLAEAARLLGYEPSAERPALPADEKVIEARAVEPSAGAEAEIVSGLPAPVPLWRVIARDFLTPLEVPSAATGEWGGLDAATPPGRPLNRWQALLPPVRAACARLADGPTPDLARLVQRMSKGRPLDRIPRLKRRHWGAVVRIVVDRSRRLVPFWADQDAAACRLATLFPHQGVDWALIDDEALAASLDDRLPAPGSLVVVLGDLGCLAGDPDRLLEMWERFGRGLAARGCRLAALTPAPPERWRPDALPSWTLIAWERGGARTPPTPAERAARAERLLTLLSPAIRIEPGLLRDLRIFLGDEADAGTEADVWQHPALAGRSSVAATLAPKAAARLRAAFSQLPPDLRAAALERLRRWRGGDLAHEVWFEELLSLDPAAIRDLPDDLRRLLHDHDLPAATRFWIGKALEAVERGDTLALCWYRGVYARASSHYHNAAPAALRQAQYRMFLKAFETRKGAPPPGFDPALIPGDPTREREVELWQVGESVQAAERGAGGSVGSPLATLRTTDLVALDIEPPEDRNAFWKSGTPPAWAEDWGRDEFGAWVTFRVGAVVTRLRWCPPGRFLMGSPEDEPGRWEDEGPRHPVTISRGFWLMETPCTQGLWQAVMGSNPSRFQSPDRPVECVSWDNAQAFIVRLNERLPGLGLSLPTEAQWEYACRAGTTSALYSGDIEILGANNAPALDAIAWYGGNSGVGFDLENGEDSSSWRDKQYPHDRAGTRPVKGKHPNQWGLHDMLGNVREWCRDGRRKYSKDAQTDPTGPLEAGADRALRGGSWIDVAQDVRAASRDWSRPGFRDRSFGFRCSRVQVVSPASRQGGAEPSGPAWDREGRSPGPSQARTSGAVLRLDRGEATDSVKLPRAPSLWLKSDRERLTLERFTLPGWADAIGRDRFGLWVRFEIGGVRQRLRWLPPGRFLMGSPADEPERSGDEGPQHPVTLSQGFWLMDTACTQALWRAVMGDNPSRFTDDPKLPVETVGWDDVQAFLTKINAARPGLALTLPTEAQWEYACRAGTATPFSFGATITPEQVNYDGNFSYAGGTKGLYRKKTVPVASLPPNPWGFYEMHGNVWEWCRDGLREYSAEAQIDPTGPLDAGAVRALRGGSWSDGARYARAAYRYWYPPFDRYDYVGFRCSRVQVVSPAGQPRGSVPALDPGSPRQAERRGAQGQEPGRGGRKKKKRT